MSTIIERDAPAFSDHMLMLKGDELTLQNGQKVTHTSVNFNSVLATQIDGRTFVIATSQVSERDRKLIEEHTKKMNLRRIVQNTRYHEEENE